MKDIRTIIFRLTVTCLLAGLVMGSTFVITNRAKKHNEEMKEQHVMLSLLGYSKTKPAPASLAMHEVYRYIVSENNVLTTGYLVPIKGDHGSFALVTMDLDGKFIQQQPVTIAHEQVKEAGARLAAIQQAVGAGKSVRYADQTIIVTDNNKRIAYLLPGKFPGFKTFITAMVALEPDFSVRGLEIMEHEEDPGLGGEIVQKYFKNQFIGKSFETIKKLTVVKTPLPDSYRAALEAGSQSQMSADEVKKIESQYKDKDIYALTGATISSRSVTNGVKGIATKFAFRVAILDRVLAEQRIAVPF